jgi:histidinol dehydrogenase
MKLRRLSTRSPDFDTELAALTRYDAAQDAGVQAAVRAIIADVRARGDVAVLEYAARFDKVSARSLDELEVSRDRLGLVADMVATEQLEALKAAHGRIRSFHERQLQKSWEYTEADGTVLGQRVTPLERVGLYVPGGKASTLPRCS